MLLGLQTVAWGIYVLGSTQAKCIVLGQNGLPQDTEDNVPARRNLVVAWLSSLQ